MPGFRTGTVNHQQRIPAALRIVRRKLRGDLGIAVAKKTVVGIDHHEAIFGLIHHRIRTAGRDDYVFGTIAVQISKKRVESDEGASRSELLLDEDIVDYRPGRRSHGRWLCLQREA